MGDGVIRLEATRGLPDRALVKHVLGLKRPASAFVRPAIGVDVVRIFDGPDGSAVTRDFTRQDLREFRAAERRALETAAAQRGGKRPSLAISWLMAGGPDTDDVHRDATTIPADAPATLADGRPWTVADCLRYGMAGHDLLREALPTAKWMGALHLDEKGVHFQAEMVGIVLDEHGHARVGNAVIRESVARLAPDFSSENARVYEQRRRREAAAEKREASARAAGRTPKKKRRRWIDRGPDHVYLTAQAQLRLVHDVYAERFADFGIVRGKGGRRQHHERVDRGLAMEAKLRAVRHETEQLEARAVRAREDAQRAEAHETHTRLKGEALDDRLDAVQSKLADAETERRAGSVGLASIARIFSPSGARVLDEAERSQHEIRVGYEARIADLKASAAEETRARRAAQAEIETVKGEGATALELARAAQRKAEDAAVVDKNGRETAEAANRKLDENEERLVLELATARDRVNVVTATLETERSDHQRTLETERSDHEQTVAAAWRDGFAAAVEQCKAVVWSVLVEVGLEPSGPLGQLLFARLPRATSQMPPGQRSPEAGVRGRDE